MMEDMLKSNADMAKELAALRAAQALEKNTL